MPSTRKCHECKISFTPTPGSKGLYCLPACWDKAKSARYKAKAQYIKNEKINEYLKAPSLCVQCQSILPYDKRKNKFCSSSCAATFNNTGRVRSAESKAAMAVTMKDLYACDSALKTKSARSGPNNSRYKDGRSIPKSRSCIMCNKTFTSTRKTCSDACKSARLSQRASDYLRKNRHKYVGPTQRSWMEQTFVDWLEAQGISQGIYGYWEQVHFKHKPEGKTRNGWADFVFVSRRLIIELDGNHHRTRQIQDHMRDAHLRTRGYEVIRITHTEYRRKTKLNLIREKLGM